MDKLRAQAEYLRETKELMRSALVSHGVSIKVDTPFRAYVEGINEAVAKAGNSTEDLAAVRAKLKGVLDAPQYVSTDAGVEIKEPLSIEESDLLGVFVIRRYAMYQHAGLVSLSIPENVSSVDPSAFYGCAGLKTVTLPQKIKLQGSCFANCTALERVFLPAVTNASQIPTLAQVNAFNNTTCSFVVRTTANKLQLNQELYTADSNWNTYAGRFIFEEVTT